MTTPDRIGNIELAPGYVREVVEAYDDWTGNDQLPAKLRELIMIFRIELARR